MGSRFSVFFFVFRIGELVQNTTNDVGHAM